jgi:hypothetical protein
MGRMKEVYAQREEARPVAFKLLMETKYELHQAYELAWKRVRSGLIETDGQVLCDVINELHREGEPLKGVTVVIPETREREVG